MKTPTQLQHFSVDNENKPKKEQKKFLFQLFAILRFNEFTELSKEQQLT